MTQEISALMDGELDPQEAGRAIGVCCKDANAARLWDEYHLIGDALRGEAGRNSAVAERVSQALAAEPTVLSPRALRPASALRVALAVAASVATVAVVGWMGLQQGGDPIAPTTLAVAPAPVVQPVARTTRPAVPAPDPHDYLVAHRQIPSAEFYRPVAARQP